MLDHKNDMDRMFDVTIKRSIPFLVYPSVDFRNRLAKLVVSLALNYREHNENDFNRRIEDINILLDNAQFDDILSKNINVFRQLQTTLESMYYQLDDRVTLLEDRLTSFENNNFKRKHKRKPQFSDISIKPKCCRIEDESCRKLSDDSIVASRNKIVLDFLIQSENPVTVDDIKKYTNLTIPKIHTAISELRKAEFLIGYRIISENAPKEIREKLGRKYKIVMYRLEKIDNI